jgi:transglutaminase-like putative cysteine protease
MKFGSLSILILSGFVFACGGNDPDPQATLRAPREASFRITNEFKLKVPAGEHSVRIWLPLPQEGDDSQLAGGMASPTRMSSRVTNNAVSAPFPVSFHADSEGNRIAYLEGTTSSDVETELVMVNTFELHRKEVFLGKIDPEETRPITDDEREALSFYLQGNTHIPVGGDVMGPLAADIVGSETNPVRMHRLIFDWVLANIDYWVKDPANKKASSTGDAVYCLNTGTGNCSDFGSLYVSIARSAGLPVRIPYGGLLKDELNGLANDASYHCWVENFIPNFGWVPLDPSIADLWYADNYNPDGLTPDQQRTLRLTAGSNYTGPSEEHVDYYFSNMDERRVIWFFGRDLNLSPQQAGPPVNHIIKGYFEMDGVVQPEWTWAGSALERLNTYELVSGDVGALWPVE